MKKIPLHILLVLGFGALMVGMSWRTPMWMDEYCFYRLTLGLPNYSATADWFFKDRPAMLAPSIDWENKTFDRETMFRIVYDTPIYPHTPLVPILMYPIVKGLDTLANYGIIPHIEEEEGYTYEATKDTEEYLNLRAEFITNILRSISITLSCVTMWLIFKLMEKKVGKKTAYFFSVPIGASTMVLYGAFLFYWDVFMMFFFVLTLYLMEVHPKSKWKYVTACCLVNTKMFLGIAFLFILFVKAFKDELKMGWKLPIPGWKMVLPALSILPFYFATLIVTGDPLYLYEHYIAQVPIHDFIYTLNTLEDYIRILLTLGMQFYIPLTLPILFYVGKYPEYALLWAGSMFYAWATGLGITHASTMTYAGALVFPLVANEWHLYDRIHKLITTNKLSISIQVKRGE